MRNKETVMSTTSQTALRELDRRISDGFDVRLLWDAGMNRVFITVEDQRYGEWQEFEVGPARALEAFQHPFAYSGNQSTAETIPSL
jgi:hypothetical protein